MLNAAPSRKEKDDLMATSTQINNYFHNSSTGHSKKSKAVAMNDLGIDV